MYNYIWNNKWREKINPKEVTLKEISKRANVSISTVSAILNNNPNCFAGEKTRKKVIEIVEELGYYPNFLYRSIRNKKTNTIGLIIPHLYYSEITVDIELLESLLWEKGYHLFIGYTKNDLKKEEGLIKDFLSRRVDGIIFVIGKGKENKNNEIEKIINRGYPFITIGRFGNLRTDFITTDYYKGGCILAEHLYKMGYRNLGVVFGKNEKCDLSIEERKRGFLEYAKEKNLVVKEYYLKSKDYTSVEELIKDSEIHGEEILKNKNRPDAIFTSNDEIAVGIIKSAIKLGIKIPDELGVAGFDNSLSSILSPVPITTIRQKKEEVAKEAVEAMIGKLEKNKIKIEKFIEPELIKRDSTGIRPEILYRGNPRVCLK
jgi:DNA-binding LacI/PurR family transcriptional regulator